MKKVALILGLLLVPALVVAAPDPKVFVCKYVGTPGTDERLQTGNNPISVSQNAIPNFQGVGSYFADKHGRSFVLAFDTGQPEPDVSECPTVANPTPTPTPTPTPNPTPTPSSDPKEEDSVPNLRPEDIIDYPGVK